MISKIKIDVITCEMLNCRIKESMAALIFVPDIFFTCTLGCNMIDKIRVPGEIKPLKYSIVLRKSRANYTFFSRLYYSVSINCGNYLINHRCVMHQRYLRYQTPNKQSIFSTMTQIAGSSTEKIIILSKRHVKRKWCFYWLTDKKSVLLRHKIVINPILQNVNRKVNLFTWHLSSLFWKLI